jgi:hypothetical protein
MSTATTTTRTVLVITDASGSWGTTDLTESRIVDLIERAAERYYRDRDDVTQFEVLARLEQYSTVQLPADYDRADSEAITDLAWTTYCETPVKSRGKVVDIIVNSTEVRRHNGQCEYGLWMPLDEQTEDVIDVVVDEVLEARCRDCRREEHEDGNTDDAGRVTIGGQIWVYRR